MKPVFTPLVLLAALAGLAFSTPAFSDQAQADCDVHEHGDRKPNQSGPCTFSQRQGYIDIGLKNGLSYSLSPQGAPNTFTDQNGKNVKRIEADGNMHKYKWKHKNIAVYFNGMPSAAMSQGESSSSNGPAEWDRGCEDAKMGSYDRSSHTDAYEEGWQACNKQEESSSSNGPAEWDRGCEDAKMGSYDRSSHTDAYEEGWQACKK